MEGSSSSYSFSELPDDVQLSILSFLEPEEIAGFSRTSKRFSELYRDGRSRLWRSLCDRKWGHLTVISAWGQGVISYKFLYRALHRWDNLLGFWRQWSYPSVRPSVVHQSQANPPTLMFLEWGPWFLTGSMVSPAEDGSRKVVTTPFLWIWITPKEEIACYMDPDGRVGKQFELSDAWSDLNLLPVNVELLEGTRLRLGSKSDTSYGSYEDQNLNDASPEETAKIYEYYANRTRSGGCRRQRRRDKDRHERRKRPLRWETEHFLKIVDSSPSSDRPLQGLWKGINEDMKLEFYLITYDILGLSCRRISDLSGGRLASCKPVFWTADATLFEGLRPEDALAYDRRIHVATQFCEPRNGTVTHYMVMNSSYDLVLSGLTEVFKNPGQVEGRVWQYANGTFGFTFLRDDFIVDLSRIALDGRLLDVAAT